MVTGSTNGGAASLSWSRRRRRPRVGKLHNSAQERTERSLRSPSAAQSPSRWADQSLQVPEKRRPMSERD
jgi:hypothetical protein